MHPSRKGTGTTRGGLRVRRAARGAPGAQQQVERAVVLAAAAGAGGPEHD